MWRWTVAYFRSETGSTSKISNTPKVSNTLGAAKRVQMNKQHPQNKQHPAIRAPEFDVWFGVRGSAPDACARTQEKEHLAK